MALIKYNPLPHQRTFHFSEKPNVYLSAGYGAGKSYALVQKMFRLMDINRGVMGGILCPTLKSFFNDVYPLIQSACEDANIEPKFNQQRMSLDFKETKSKIIIFHSEDEGRSIKGPNLGWGLINEVTLVSHKAYLAFLSRMRDRRSKLIQIGMSGTPEGFNWAYKNFIKNPRSDTELIFGNSRENIYNADSYIAHLENSYDKLMQEQFIDGKFVNPNGRPAAWSFDRFKHVKDLGEYQGGTVWVHVDFNVSPMAATMYEVREDCIYAFDEINIKNNAKTEDLAEQIEKKCGLNAILFPDPAGGHRDTRSNASDIQILFNFGFKDIRFKRSIRSVRDCLNAMNKKIEMQYIFFNPRCEETISDLEQCTLRDDWTIEKKDMERTHWIDGLKNMIDFEFPIVKIESKSVKIGRYA